ncbi:hypothetical protein [Nannocystis radixulma]|uniref:Uncharacterized protein n=1 Tax=Nannocystis radixulma TaxID=2995305 RepID=A0ABT5B185_9BACT|nr:hypothetical protein [Nannocystis radixulma]MDC0667864.1 hypothetical protein [Nannocystis radixulma]
MQTYATGATASNSHTRFEFQPRGLGKKGRLRLNAGGLTARF